MSFETCETARLSKNRVWVVAQEPSSAGSNILRPGRPGPSSKKFEPIDLAHAGKTCHLQYLSPVELSIVIFFGRAGGAAVALGLAAAGLTVPSVALIAPRTAASLSEKPPSTSSGVPAPRSVSGYEVVSNGETLGPGEERQVVVICPDGKKALGGGGNVVPSGSNVVWVGLVPHNTNGEWGDSWAVQARNVGDSAVQLNAYAVCASAT
jgi:hypothetical protein